MSKMFTFNGKRMVTWNLFTGCDFNCFYCWARELAEGKLKKSYPNGFIPTTHPDRFNKRFKPDDFVFVCSMGDISFAPSMVEQVILNHAKKYPETKFLLCTKDPDMFRQVKFHQPNVYLGATIETTEDFGFSQAPPVRERMLKMVGLSHPHKFISIEPIMDFNLRRFAQWIEDIEPEIIEIGADNYHHNLPEPEPEKVRQLLYHLKKICPVVIEKDGLQRLLSA